MSKSSDEARRRGERLRGCLEVVGRDLDALEHRREGRRIDERDRDLAVARQREAARGVGGDAGLACSGEKAAQTLGVDVAPCNRDSGALDVRRRDRLLELVEAAQQPRGTRSAGSVSFIVARSGEPASAASRSTSSGRSRSIVASSRDLRTSSACVASSSRRFSPGTAGRLA